MAPRSSDPTSVTEIGTRLALTRRALGLTQVMMARLMGSVGDGQAWENYEAGRRRISIDHAMALTQSCGIPLDWIYQGQMANLPPQLRERIQQLMLEHQLPTRRKSLRK
jgi:transcriptional regulator with XRE-family HTH domain